MVYSIVEDHKGTLDIVSPAHKDTQNLHGSSLRYRQTLPATMRQVTLMSPIDVAPPMNKILIVEDEVIIRTALRKLLTRHKYDVKKQARSKPCA